MTSGVLIRRVAGSINDVDAALAQARSAHEQGARRVWFGQQFDLDAITLAGVVATALPELQVGTAAVSINPRHPLVVAASAQTVMAASHGKFSLGIGLAGHSLERRTFGLTPRKPIGRLREYLRVLNAVFHSGGVDFAGDHVTARRLPGGEYSAAVAGGGAVPVYVAAMGEQSLAAAGELADGVITFLAGPRTIATFIRPTLDRAAGRAGRPSPRIVAIVPVVLSDDVAGGRESARRGLGDYDKVESYREVIGREGCSSASDIAVIGDQDGALVDLGRYRDAGATDLILYPLETDGAALRAVHRLAGAG
ncbi:TIGR03564 family F420-dependent LLM class oxidoreductase [Mycobacterium sp. NPDC003449]